MLFYAIFFLPLRSTKTALAADPHQLFYLEFLAQTSQSHNHRTQGRGLFLKMIYFIFFSTVLLKVSFNMFNWKMDFVFGRGEQTKQLSSSRQRCHNYEAKIFGRAVILKSV